MSTATIAAAARLSLPLDCYPRLNRFALDFTRRSEPTRPFLRSLDRTALNPSGQKRPPDLIDGLIRTNNAWGNDVASGLHAWGRGETVTLIAGQQAGFAGGPLYTLAKATSLLRLQADLRERGVASTVFFWLATEDHDLAEVSQLLLPTREGHREVRVPIRPDAPHVVGPQPIPESLRRQLLNLLGTPAPEWLHAGTSFADSFARLLVSVLGSGRMVLIDSLLPELRRAGSQLFSDLIANLDEIRSLVDRRTAQIEAAGYSRQVEPNSNGDYSLLLVVTPEGERHALRKEAHAWMIGNRQASAAEVQQIVAQHPESISTGVLARPLLQDAVLSPEVFIGGPAEVAYYAQVTALHQRLGIAAPAVALRGHALVAPAKILRALDKYGLHPEEIFLPVDEWIARHETGAISKLDGMLQSARQQIESELERLRSFVASFDPTLDRAVDHSLRKIRYQLQRVGEKGRRAIARNDADRYHAISRLSQTLAPNGEPQDRVVGWIGYWFQYGNQLIERLTAEIEPDSDRLKVIGL